MLPYTPLHLLLFRHPQAPAGYRHLIMTSGNRKGEPILTDPAEARSKLAEAADLFLTHDRRIVFRTDDSVLRVGAGSDPGAPAPLPRHTCPAWSPCAAPVSRVTLGLGGDLKNAPALARGSDVYLAPFIGDLEDPVTLSDFQRQVARILELYAVRPEAVAFDLHPLYHSSRLAAQFPEARRLGVQHHHAHALAAMAEHGLEQALALTFDGTGYGTDGTIWGGEFLEVDRRGFRRLGCFRPFPLPGGEAAVLHPLRAALALLAGRLPPAGIERLLCRDGRLTATDARFLLDMIGRGLNSPLTSSLGRVFDAAAAVLGLVDRVAYEGEGPIRMEGLALREPGARAPLASPPAAPEPAGLTPLSRPAAQEDLFQIDPSPLLVELAERAARPRPPAGGGGAALPPGHRPRGAGRAPERCGAGRDGGSWYCPAECSRTCSSWDCWPPRCAKKASRCTPTGPAPRGRRPGRGAGIFSGRGCVEYAMCLAIPMRVERAAAGRQGPGPAGRAGNRRGYFLGGKRAAR